MNQTIKTRIEKINNGEAPEGYEKVSFGIFPCDWEKDKTFGDLFDFFGGLGKSREELGDDGVPYLHYGDMHRGSFKKVNYSDYVNLPKYETVIKGNESYLMNDGDIAFLDASEDLEGTSRAVLIDNVKNEPFIAGLHTFVAKEKIKIFSKFYKQYITLPNEVYKQFRELAVGFKVYGLNRNTIKWIKIAYPTEKKEQEKIAEILMKWDEIVEAQEGYIKALELRKKALMQKLLTPKEGWEKVKLGNICDIVKGEQINGDKLVVGEKFPFYNGGVAPSGYYDSFNREKDTLIISEGGNSCGFVNLIKERFWSGGHCYSLLNTKISLVYLYYVLKNSEIEIKRLRVGSGLPNIQSLTLKKFHIFFPKLFLEQQRIADILSTADEEIRLQKQKLAEIKQQRKSLQQLLLTGIVRVNYA